MAGEGQHHHSKRPLFLLLPPTLYAEHDTRWSGISLGPAVQAVSILIPCAPPASSLAGWWEAQKAFTLCCSAITKSSLCYQQFFFAAQKQNAAPNQLLWRKLTHPQLKPANDCVCKCIFILYLVYWLRETVWNGMILNGDLESHKSALWNVIVLEAEHLWFFNYLVVLFHITVWSSSVFTRVE